MKVDELTIGEAKELAKLFTNTSTCVDVKLPWAVGEMWFFQTVTHYYTGKIKAIYGDKVVLEQVAWIPDTGRFMQFFETLNPNESEPMPDGVVICTTSLISATPISKIVVVQK